MRRRTSGIILALVSGILAVFLALGLVLMWAVRMHSAASATWVGAARSCAAAASGMEYAAARLFRDSRPRHSASAADRGDDWTWRGCAWEATDGAQNPSYAHGEPWIDVSSVADGIDNDGDWTAGGGLDEAGELDRVYRPGEAFVGLDGDGVRSGWSGRLRGGERPFACAFLLRVGSPEGGIPLNAGNLSDGPANRWGFDPNGTPYALDLDGEDRNPNGIPDHRDPRILYHAGLVQALDSLGVVVKGPSGSPAVSTRRWSIPAPGEPVLRTWLGKDLIGSRPVGGYRTWEELEGILKGLPAEAPVAGQKGAPYDAAELEAIRPFLDLDRPVPLGDWSRCRATYLPFQAGTPFDPSYTNPFCPPPLYAPVCFWTAPREVFAAAWMYLKALSPGAPPPGVSDPPPGNDFAGEPFGWDKLCPHSGLFLGDTTPRTARPFVQLLIWPEEALALADAALAYRQSAACDWEGFRRFLAAHAGRIFKTDFDRLAADIPQAPAFAWSWAQSKASLAWNAASVDPYPWRGSIYPLAAWATGGVDGNPAASGIQPPPVVGLEGVRGVQTPAAWNPADPAPYAPADRPYRMVESSYTADGIMPQGFTFAPPTRFSVESVGRCGRDASTIRGTFKPLERVELSSQEDFESIFQVSALAGREIERIAAPALSTRLGAPGGFSPSVATLPRWGYWSSGVVHEIPSFVLYGPPRTYGAVSPGGREHAHGAALSWRLCQDFDKTENYPAPPPLPLIAPPWTESDIPPWLEMWAKRDPSFAPNQLFAGAPLIPILPYRIQPDYVSPNGGALSVESAAHGHPHALDGKLMVGPYDDTGLLPGFLPERSNELEPPGALDPPLSNRSAVVKGFGMAAQFGPASSWRLVSVTPTNCSIELKTARGWEGTPEQTGTRFTLDVAWQCLEARQSLNIAGAHTSTSYASASMIDEQGVKSGTWFVPDGANGGRWSYPVQLTMERVDWEDPRIAAWFADPAVPAALKRWRWKGFVSRFTLKVGGTQFGQLDLYNPSSVIPASPLPPWPARSSGGMMAPQNGNGLRMIVGGLDEIYLSGGLVGGASDARFLDQGIFLSPLYRMDRPLDLSQVQWHGIVPPGFPPDAIRVKVVCFDEGLAEILPHLDMDQPGRVYAAAPPATPPKARAFRYEVRFDASGTDGNDAPVFESIWLTFRRDGSEPWTAWRSD